VTIWGTTVASSTRWKSTVPVWTLVKLDVYQAVDYSALEVMTPNGFSVSKTRSGDIAALVDVTLARVYGGAMPAWPMAL
jgi:hypothetical protein